jgi:uncharacterized protein
VRVKPINPANRLDQIDILRGVALFGILMVNVFGYHASFYHFGEFYRGLEDPFQKSVFNWMVNLGSDKFIFMFSTLFGFGMWMLGEKFSRQEARFKAFFLRRMLWLCGFGLLHILLFWAGDILLIYGILGLVLFSIRKLRLRVLFSLSVFFYFFTAFYLVIRIYLPGLPDPMSTLTNLTMDEIKEVYSTGSFIETMKWRINEYIVFRNINLLYYMPKVLALFILGYLAGKTGMLGKININLTQSLMLILLFLIMGLVFIFRLENILYFFTTPDSDAVMPVYIAIYEIGNLFMGLGYILMVLVVAKTKWGNTMLGILKYAGRMPLTNYLLQSLIFTTIFYGYGFGYFGKIDPSEFLIWALIVFVIQIIISKLWLMRFRFGPLEFLWRRLSYGKRSVK